MFHFLGDHLHMRNNSRWAPLLCGNSYSRPGNSSLNVLNNKIGQNQNYTKAHYPPIFRKKNPCHLSSRFFRYLSIVLGKYVTYTCANKKLQKSPTKP